MVLHSKKNCAQKNLVEYLHISQKGFIARKIWSRGFIKHSTYSFNLVISIPPTPEKNFFYFFFSKKKQPFPIAFPTLKFLYKRRGGSLSVFVTSPRPCSS
jgi:hypothetical protein